MAKPKVTRREALLAAGKIVGCAALVSIGASGAAQVSGDKVVTAREQSPSRPHDQVPASDRTSLGLSVTPQEAYEMWKAKPDRVHIIDVRTFEEYVFVGHAEMARNIPLLFPKFKLPAYNKPQSASPSGGPPPGCYGVPNPDFVSTVKARFTPTDTLLMMCATGGRGAMAVNQLAKAGFVHVYNIINGLEGDRVNDPESVYHGKRMRNGWKNCGLPWTYDFDPDLMWVSPKRST